MIAIVFSKDRPLQLDATLRSLLLHCRDIRKVSLRVLCKASTPDFARGYHILEKEYQDEPQISFHPETDFRSQVLYLARDIGHLLFLVDDNLFVRDFSISSCMEALDSHPDALGYSLRLGRNTTYCYPHDAPQPLPLFIPVSAETLKFDWTTGSYDFGYPLEVSSSLYRTKEILPLLASIPFHNPNSLEAAMASYAGAYSKHYPWILCGATSLTFCNPMNMVQSTAVDNRRGTHADLSPERLLNCFLEGKRVDISSFDGFIPDACHQEKELNMVWKHASLLPRVSVVIPCYNQAGFLTDAVESVIFQTFSNWECIIVNDGSPDETSEVARGIIERFPDKKIRLLEKENGGLAEARNTGIEASLGEYILPLDADDQIHPEMLEKLARLLDQNPDIAIAYTDVRTFGANKGVIRAAEYDFNALLKNNQLNYCSMYRREIWEAVGGYNPNMLWGYEDWDFWIGCGERGYYARRVPEPLLYYRVKESSMFTKALERDQELRARIVLNHPSLYERQIVAGAFEFLQLMSGCSFASPPMVSVIVPTFNRPEMLAQALKSIITQTYQDFEIIIVNDAGVDVAPLVKHFNTKGVIRYINKETNQGLAAARNTGIKAARGKYIAYLDDDDYFYPDHLETLVNFLEEHSYQVAYSDAARAIQEKIGDTYNTIRKDTPYGDLFDADRLLVENYIPVLCVMHEKKCLDQIGLFDESLPRHEDWDLWIRLTQCYTFAHIPKITAEFSHRDTDQSGMTSGTLPSMLVTLERIYEKSAPLAGTRPQVIARRKSYLFDLKNRIHGFLQDKLEAIPDCPESDTELRENEIIEQLGKTGATRNQILAAYYHKLGLLNISKDPAAALAYFSRALAADPVCCPVHRSIAETMLQIGETEKAVRHCEVIISQEPNDPELIDMVACMTRRLGNRDKADFLEEKARNLRRTMHAA